MIDRDIFDRLTQHIEEIQRQNDNQSPRFIVCGDLNARIGKLNDYVSFDDGRHIEALPNDYVGDNTLPRITSDESVNDNGNLLIDFCIQTGLRIANGRVGADAMEGKCTYVGSRGSSLIDYVIVSEDLLSHISDFYVSDPNILSDHCTVNFVIQNSISETKDEEVDFDKNYVQTKYVWDKSLLDAYKLAISSSNIIENFDSLFENSQDVSSMDGIDNCVESFVGILDSVCEPRLEKKLPTFNSDIPHKNDSNVLYNEECEIKKQIVFTCLIRYRNCRNDENRIEMVEARTAFKNSVRHFWYECKKQKNKTLIRSEIQKCKRLLEVIEGFTTL